MFRINVQRWMIVVVGAFSSISYATQTMIPDLYATQQRTSDLNYTFAQRTTQTTQSPLELSLSVNPFLENSAASSRMDVSQGTYWQTQSYWQDQLEICKRNLVVAQQHDNLSSVFAHETEVRNFSESQLLRSNNELEQTITVLQSQLEVLLDKQNDFQSRGILLYRPSTDGPIGYSDSLFSSYEWVSSAKAQQVCACIENQAAIANVRREIGHKESCLRNNYAKLDALAQEQVKASALKQGALAEQEILKLQDSNSKTIRLCTVARSEIDGLRSDLATARGKIEFLDHWYMIGSGTQLEKFRAQEKRLIPQIEQLEKTVSALQNSVRVNQNEVTRLQPIVAEGKKYLTNLTECARQQEITKSIDAAGAKERVAAVNETAASKGLQGVILIEFTREGQELLKLFGIDVKRFSSFDGNALQKQLSNELRDIINRSGKTLVAFKDFITIRAYLEATARTCEVANDVIRKGTPCQATAWTDLAHLCEKATQVAIGAVRGAVKGVLGTGEMIADAVVHPQEFIAQCKSVVCSLLGVDGVSIDKNGQYMLTDTRWAKLQEMCKQFAQLPLEKEVEHAAAMLASLIIPGPNTKMLTDFFKALAPINQVMKIEALGLQLGKFGKSEAFWNAPLGVGISEAINDTMKQAASALSKEKVAELAAKALQVQKDAKMIAATGPQANLGSQLAKMGLESGAKVTTEAQQVAKAVTTTAKTEVSAAQATAKISKEEIALAKAAAQTKPATHIASTVVEAEVKVSAATVVGEKSALKLTEAEVKAAVAARKTVANATKEVKWGHWNDLPKVNLGQEYAIIGDKLYTKHAIDRMLPKTDEIIKALEAEALSMGLKRGESEFIKYVQPRNVPPIVVEDAIANGIRSVGKESNTLIYCTKNIQVVTFTNGIVKTLYPI